MTKTNDFKRYYQSTITTDDGRTVIVFRATETAHYRSARNEGIPSFSAKPAGIGSSPAVEITKAEYEALQARKITRLRAAGAAPHRDGRPWNSWIEA